MTGGTTVLMIYHPHLIHNKYYYWYTKLIEAYVISPINQGYELHHIVPRSMGGTDDKSNLVRLPIRHHYVAHLLLWKCTVSKSQQRMAYAITAMKAGRSIRMNSHLYEAAKIQAKQYKSDHASGKFAARNASGDVFYIHRTDPRYASGELVALSKGRLLGSKQSDDHKRKIAVSKLAKNNPNHKWTITTPLGTFNSLGEAASAHNTSRTTVLNRCNSQNFPDWIKTSDT